MNDETHVVDIYVWPDGTWVDVDEYNPYEYAMLGNDFATLSVTIPDDCQDADTFIEDFLEENS